MKEAERGLGIGLQRLPVTARGFEQSERADDIGLDEIGSAGDRAVDMALGGKVHHPIGPESGHGNVHRGPVADIGLEEAVMRVAFDIAQRLTVAGISQRVDRKHLVVRRHKMNPAPPVTMMRIAGSSFVGEMRWKFGQFRLNTILGRKRVGLGQIGPFDCDRRIVPGQARVMLGAVEGGDLV